LVGRPARGEGFVLSSCASAREVVVLVIRTGWPVCPAEVGCVGWWEGWPDGELVFVVGMGFRKALEGGVGCWRVLDEPESLILAQSERWRHA
jgi:hypothetical protein